MRSRNYKNKSQNKENPKMYFCKLCAFIARDKEELNMHYELEHDEGADLLYILAKKWEEEMKKRPKLKTLKDKALYQLKLLIEGKDVHDEYVGWCKVPYYITTRKVGNRYVIGLESGVWEC